MQKLFRRLKYIKAESDKKKTLKYIKKFLDITQKLGKKERQKI
jgi:hypothetical protein